MYSGKTALHPAYNQNCTTSVNDIRIHLHYILQLPKAIETVKIADLNVRPLLSALAEFHHIEASLIGYQEQQQLVDFEAFVVQLG